MREKYHYIGIVLHLLTLSKLYVFCGQCDSGRNSAGSPVEDTLQLINTCWNSTEKPDWNRACFDSRKEIAVATSLFCHQLRSTINSELNFTVLTCTGYELPLQECNSTLTTDQCEFISGVLHGCDICGNDSKCLYSGGCSITETVGCVCQTECFQILNKNRVDVEAGSSSAGVIILILVVLALISITVILFICLKVKRNASSLSNSIHSKHNYSTMPKDTDVQPENTYRIDNSQQRFNSGNSSSNTSSQRQAMNRPGATNNSEFNSSIDSIEHEESRPVNPFSPPPNKPKYRPQLHSSTKFHPTTSTPILTRRKATTTVQHGKDMYLSLISGVIPFEITDPSIRLERSSSTLKDLTCSVKRFVNPPHDMKSLRNSTISANEINKLDLVIQEEIAHGQFGIVYRALYTPAEGDPILVAVKTLKNESNKEAETAFRREALILDQFQHPNILALIGFVSVSPYMIVTELLKSELGHLLEKLKDCPVDKWNLPPLLLNFCIDIAVGMSYLANMKIIHRDLAARNILVAKDLSCRIADFGLSHQLTDDEGDYYISKGGQIPLKWSAPESVFHKKFSEKSDVWSFGMTMYEIWALGAKPWGGLTNEKVLKHFSDGEKHFPPTGCNREVYIIMLKTWHSDQTQRPDFARIFKMLDKIQLPPPTPESDPALILGNDHKLAADLYKSLRTS